MTDELTATEAM